MSGEIDLFKQMTNAVLDLQSAQLQSYARPLKTLARLLRHSDLAPANSALTQDLDLDVFLTESEKSQGGMVGSAQLAWPESSEKMLGLTLLLIERFAEDPGFALDVNAAKRAEERGQRESFHVSDGILVLRATRARRVEDGSASRIGRTDGVIGLDPDAQVPERHPTGVRNIRADRKRRPDGFASSGSKACSSLSCRRRMPLLGSDIALLPLQFPLPVGDLSCAVSGPSRLGRYDQEHAYAA